MEDLTPKLSEEIVFCSKLYNEDIGRIIYSALITDNIRQNNCFEEISFFLKNREGRSDAWIEHFIECFRGIFWEQASEKDDFVRVKNAVENGDIYCLHILGEMYQEGRGIEKDYVEAVKWYRLASENGDVRGDRSLAYMYSCGMGVKQNFTEAAYYYKKAAEKGDSLSQYWLGVFYRTGLGVESVNEDKSIHWYMLSAKAGNTDAQRELGHMFYSWGSERIKDVNHARLWYQVAADQGDSESKRILDSLKI